MSHDFSTVAVTRVARKAHWCKACGKRIQPGEPYWTWSGKWNGDFGVMKLHLPCHEKTKDWDTDAWEVHSPGDSLEDFSTQPTPTMNNTNESRSDLDTAYHADPMGAPTSHLPMSDQAMIAVLRDTVKDLREELAATRADRDIKVTNLTEQLEAARADATIKGENLALAKARLALLRDAVLSVLCDPEGTSCFAGSDGDRKVVADALAACASEEPGVTDTQRLDWLDREGIDVCFDEGDPSVGLFETFIIGKGKKLSLARESGLRDAIDAAMKMQSRLHP